MAGMQSRKDLLAAHRLMTQRASLALLRGEPDVPDQPLRRLNVAAFSSALVAMIVAAIFVVLAVLGHGGSQLKLAPGMLLIDKQTGAPYVVCQKRKLCPVLNYASARLALGSSPVSQQTVSQDSLTKYPRGPLIGIPGLPQPLPEAGLLMKGPWSVCARTAPAGSTEPFTTVLAGGTDPGGRPLRNTAIPVQAAGRDWVLWRGQRFAVQAGTLAALSSTREQPVAIAPVWLDALAQGPDLAAPVITGLGKRVTGPAGGTVRVGQVYRVSSTVSGPPVYYVMLTDGLARISQTQAVLLEFAPSAPSPGALSPSQVRGHLSTTTLSGNGLPGHMPAITRAGPFTTLCDIYRPGGNGTGLTGQVTIDGRMPAGGAPASGQVGTGQAEASQVALPPGAGALVGAAPGSGQPVPGASQSASAVSYFLITGGRKYGLASNKVAAMLGYSLASQSVLLPAGVVDLIPQGPALDPAAAARPVTPGG